jgi:hypothetical protein
VDVALSWASRSLIDPYSPEMLAVVREALPRNRALGLTGALCFTPTSFFQILEGPEPAVAEVFRRIEADWRHTQVTRLDVNPIGARLFQGHEMKFVDCARHHALGRPIDFDSLVAMGAGQRRDLALSMVRV